MTQVGERVSDEVEPRETATWLKIFVVTGAILAVLLLGAAIGLLIQTGDDKPDVPGADSVDVGFSQDMSEHHRQATVMAATARDKSTDPDIVGLAFDIETGQLEQIGRMQGWLSLWDALPLAPGGHMAWMTPDSMAGMGHHAHGGGTSVSAMPGMATTDELKQLRTMPAGRDFDVFFLQLMLRHHQGGIQMANDAAEHAEVGQVRNLAKQMSLAQTGEVGLLTEMLAERGAQPLPPPS